MRLDSKSPEGSTGFYLSPYGPVAVIKHDGIWWDGGSALLLPKPIFSTEAEAIAGKVRKQKKARKTAKTHAEMTARED